MTVDPGIAVTIDGTPATDAALTRAVVMAREQQAPLTGVFVIDSGWPDFIGNDWQSARNARQGFLDYVRAEQQQQAALAEQQFIRGTNGMPGARFCVRVGDPAESLRDMMKAGEARVLVVGEQAFRTCGRPSAKKLVRTLLKAVPGPVVVC